MGIKRRSIFNAVNIIMLIVIVGFIIMSIYQYQVFEEKTKASFESSLNLVTYSMKDRLRAIDKIYYALELSIDQELEYYVQEMIEIYEQDNLSADTLNGIKDNSLIDLYVIDEDNTVIMTTFKPDLGLNFDQFEDFSKFLDYVRKEKKYISERISLSTFTSEIKKYAYQGTLDGKYIVEASYEMTSFNDFLATDSFESFSSNIIEKNNFIKNLNVYNYFGNNFNSTTSIYDSSEQERIECFDKSLKNLETTSYQKDNGIRTTITKYIPYAIKNFNGSDTIYILELVYTDDPIRKDLKDWKLNILLTAGFMMIIFTLISVYINKRILSPVRNLLEGFQNVSDGDLSARIEVSGNKDLTHATGTFNEMITYIQELLENQLRNEDSLKELLIKNEAEYFETVRALANAIDAKDHYTSSHCERVLNLSVLLGEYLNLDEEAIKTLQFGSLLHDVGKIGIADNILNKIDKLTNEEYEIIQSHTKIGYDIVKDISFLKPTSQLVLCHHEKMDGTGYPNNLEGNDIPRLARIISIVDAFDAMTSERVYKPRIMTVKQAFNELTRCSGTQFDTELVGAFIEAYKDKYGENINTLASFIE